MAACEFCFWESGSRRWNYRNPATPQRPKALLAQDRFYQQTGIYGLPYFRDYGHPAREGPPELPHDPPVEQRVALTSFVCQHDGCLNDTLICWECVYHNRHRCSVCERKFGPECMDWPEPGGMTRVCVECAEEVDEIAEVVVKRDLEEVQTEKILTCKKHHEFDKKDKKPPVILVVSDGVNFDYSTKLAAAKPGFFVVATQFDFTGWPLTKAPAQPNHTMWPTSFDVTRVEHWKEILETHGPFRAILFNNPLIGYFFHRIFAKGTNAKLETWDAIHSLTDAPFNFRTDNCFYPQKHATGGGEIWDFSKASSLDDAVRIPMEKIYTRTLPDVDDLDFRKYYNLFGGTSNGRTFLFNVHYRKSIDIDLPGFQWFVLRCYHNYGRECLDGEGTIEVNTPAVIAPQLKQIGFAKSGGFQAGPYGQPFNVELTHYGWHPSWPMFDHQFDGESAPQDGAVTDMSRFVAK